MKKKKERETVYPHHILQNEATNERRLSSEHSRDCIRLTTSSGDLQGVSGLVFFFFSCHGLLREKGMREREIELNPVQSLINPTVDRRCFSPGRRSKRLHFLINSPSRSQLVRSERGAQPEVIRLSLRALSRPRGREKNGWLEFASSDLKGGIIFSSRSSALHLSLFHACHYASHPPPPSIEFFASRRMLSAVSITCLNRMIIDSAAMHARSPVAFVRKDIKQNPVN